MFVVDLDLFIFNNIQLKNLKILLKINNGFQTLYIWLLMLLELYFLRVNIINDILGKKNKNIL